MESQIHEMKFIQEKCVPFAVVFARGDDSGAAGLYVCVCDKHTECAIPARENVKGT
jgi:hypothetical protein